MAASSRFPFAQLLHFILDPSPLPAAGFSAPPQRLLLAFPSRDVTLTGYRPNLLCDSLDQQQALRLKAEDVRFANLHPQEPFVSSVTVAQPTAT